MNQFAVNDQFNCSVGCENPNQCEYYNDLPPNQVIPQLQNYAESGNYFYSNNFDDGVVPANSYPSINNQQVECYPSYQELNQTAVQPDNVLYNQTPADQTAGFSGGSYFIDNVQTYPPCQGPQPWNYAQCYGYYGEAPCQFANVVDMEDFM